MRVLLLPILAALFGGAAPRSTPHDTPAKDFVVRCGKLYAGEGPALRDVWMSVRDGKIVAIGNADSMPTDLPVLDASDKVVMPGIVAADTFLSGQRDSDYNVTPDFVAVDGFDFERRLRSPLSGGVTTAYLGVGRARLVPGQGSVVKLFGDDVVARVLADSCALQITLGDASTQAPPVFEPTLSPTDDDPLSPARRQFPTARISQLSTLRALFDEAQRVDTTVGSSMVENRYDPAAMRSVIAGQLPLRINAQEAADIVRSLNFAKRLGARAVIENPFELEQIVDRIARAKASLVLHVPVHISASNPGGTDRRDQAVVNRPDNAAIAARAGITFALAPSDDGDLDDYLFVAGIAIRHGLDEATAMRSITIDAARTLGVEDRVGSLRAGKDADFLVLSGEPFAVGTMVEKTFVDGQPAFERELAGDLLAIRAGRIITMDGPVLRDATILIGGGKIKAVGEELAIPYGARLINLPDAVITPGFIDAFTSAGLAGDGTGIPSGAPDQLVGSVVRHDDATFEPARGAGLTTLLVAGPDGGAVSGRVAAIKTGAADSDSLVLRKIAAIRMVHDDIGPESAKPLSDLFDRGQKYIDSWKDFAKKRAEWEAKRATEGDAAATAEDDTATTEFDPVSGTWECGLEGLPIPIPIELTLKLKLRGTKVTGTLQITIGGQDGPPPREIDNGKFEAGQLTFQVTLMGDTGTVTATIADDVLTGSIEGGPQPFEIVGKRTSKDAKVDKSQDKGPQEPKIDEALEPIRAVIEGHATAVVNVNRAPAVRAVIEFFREKKLPFVLHGVDDAVESPDVLGAEPPPILLGPTLVMRDKGRIVNAAAVLADRGAPLAFGSGDALGCQYLPVHAAHAIRWGLDPEAALRALTIDAARMFKLDDRVGSLARGKDADLVVFSGNPFEMTSRVMLVVCNGRVVVDARERSDR